MADLPISKERMIATLGAAEVGGKSANELSQGKFVGLAHVNLADRSWVNPSATENGKNGVRVDLLIH